MNRLLLIIKEELQDYVGSHSAPAKEDNAPMYDVSGIYPDDFYSSKALRQYGHGEGDDALAISIIQSAHNKPNMPIKIYRAVPYVKTNQEQINDYYDQLKYIQKYGRIPSGINSPMNKSDYYDMVSNEIDRLKELPEENNDNRLKINNGDWVTITPSYAREHGKGNLGNKFKIISKTVPAKMLYTDGNSIHEWGYNM